MTVPEALAEQRARVAALAELLGGDELAVLELVAHGLTRGRGDELRDALVYVAAELLRLRRRA